MLKIFYAFIKITFSTDFRIRFRPTNSWGIEIHTQDKSTVISVETHPFKYHLGRLFMSFGDESSKALFGPITTFHLFYHSSTKLAFVSRSHV